MGLHFSTVGHPEDKTSPLFIHMEGNYRKIVVRAIGQAILGDQAPPTPQPSPTQAQ
jgi:hypothetical protein